MASPALVAAAFHICVVLVMSDVNFSAKTMNGSRDIKHL